MTDDVAHDVDVTPHLLRTADDSGLVSCASVAPNLTWQLAATRPDVRSLAYQIAVSATASFAEAAQTFPIVEGEVPLFVPWPDTPLRSRETRWWRVRVRTDRGWTPWSDPARVEGTLFAPSDWTALPVSPRSNSGRVERSPAILLRKDFDAAACCSARLYVTALGVHRVRINGNPVSNDLLEPGWTDHRHRTLFSAYDILPLLREGANCIAAEVSDGWWRGELGWLERRGIYGDTTALIAQVELVDKAGERHVIATDQTWRGGYGALKLAELYDGVDMDLRAEPEGWDRAGFDDSAWEDVIRLDLPPGLEQRAMPAVRVIDCYDVQGEEHVPGVLRIDAAQNIVGHLRIHASGPAGAKVSVRHAEVREDDGSLHLAPLRNARAADNYILRGHGDELLEPRFTFHGFRFAEVRSDPGVVVTGIEIVQIGSDLAYTGRFECSDQDINTLFANTVRSQKGNFVALPTDCPQRDERLGWTGDIQVFAETACFNADARSFLGNWLVDLATEQRADGNVTSTVPNVIEDHEFAFGGVGWGDAATLVPWTLYSMYGDLPMLERQYPSMRKWVDYGASRLGPDGTWSGDFHLGDWLDPGAPSDQPHMATTDRDFIASAYLSFSAARVGDAALALGREDDARTFHALSRQVADAAWHKWRDAAVTTQTGCGIAIMFDIAPVSEVAAVGKALAALVDANDGRIATGFLGTPLVLPALSRAGQSETAYRLLFNRQCPGWLYQVDRGATTMWERWDAVQNDGSLHSGAMDTGEANAMISFNHYAYGAVSAWLYRNVAGISPDPARPGFAHILFAPEPGGGLSWARASLTTGYGPAAIRWERSGDGLLVDLTVPLGTTATFRCPEGFALANGGSTMDLGSGDHRLKLGVAGKPVG